MTLSIVHVFFMKFTVVKSNSLPSFRSYPQRSLRLLPLWIHHGCWGGQKHRTRVMRLKYQRGARHVFQKARKQKIFLKKKRGLGGQHFSKYECYEDKFITKLIGNTKL